MPRHTRRFNRGSRLRVPLWILVPVVAVLLAVMIAGAIGSDSLPQLLARVPFVGTH